MLTPSPVQLDRIPIQDQVFSDPTYLRSLAGTCDEDELLLVAELLPNDTLAKRLFHQKNQTMEWSMRLQVAYCIAESLDNYCTAGFTKYNNLSAYSVLFDKDGDACLSCFGLVREIIIYDRRTGGSHLLMCLK